MGEKNWFVRVYYRGIRMARDTDLLRAFLAFEVDVVVIVFVLISGRVGGGGEENVVGFLQLIRN